MKTAKCNKLIKQLRRILSERLPDDQSAALIKDGFNVKAPTRYTACAVALYRKAAVGDVTAIKALNDILNTADGSTSDGNKIVFIDDLIK